VSRGQGRGRGQELEAKAKFWPRGQSGPDALTSLVTSYRVQTRLNEKDRLTSFRWSKYCDQRVCVAVCFICLSVRLLISQTTCPHSRKFLYLYMLPVAVARSSSDGSAICYLLPVLCMTSDFRIMKRMAQNQRWPTIHA